jgi:hypothetical protein
MWLWPLHCASAVWCTAGRCIRRGMSVKAIDLPPAITTHTHICAEQAEAAAVCVCVGCICHIATV